MSLTDDLRAGKLEQTCRSCGRWEAAHWYCSFCYGPMVPGKDWYRNGDLAERHGRCPVDVPASPPPEYRDDKRQWPVTWGPWPGVQRAPQEAQTPLKQPSDDTLGL